MHDLFLICQQKQRSYCLLMKVIPVKIFAREHLSHNFLRVYISFSSETPWKMVSMKTDIHWDHFAINFSPGGGRWGQLILKKWLLPQRIRSPWRNCVRSVTTCPFTQVLNSSNDNSEQASFTCRHILLGKYKFPQMEIKYSISTVYIEMFCAILYHLHNLNMKNTNGGVVP